MSTCKRVHLVTGSYFQSRKKDGDHAIRSPIGKNPMLHARTLHHCALQRPELLAMENLTCTEVNTCRHPLYEYVLLTLFQWCDLDPTTFIHKLASRYTRCAVLLWTLYVKAFDSYHLTDRQTDR